MTKWRSSKHPDSPAWTPGVVIDKPLGAVPPPINPPPPPAQPMRLRGEGLVIRFSPVKNVTPKSVLGKNIWLPVVLNNFTIDEEANITEYDTLSAGQFSQSPQGGTNARELRSSTLETLTIDFDPPWIVASGQDPWDLRVRIFEIMRSKKPVNILGTFHPYPDDHSELQMAVTLRRISREIRPAERETRYLTIDVKEWRDPSIRRREHRTTPSSSRKRGQQLPTTHALKAGDTLYSLSMEFYGTYQYWQLIRDANGMPKKFGRSTKIVTLPGKFKTGYKIKIPDVPWRGSQQGDAPSRSSGGSSVTGDAAVG